jgi:hypothetical protein
MDDLKEVTDYQTATIDLFDGGVTIQFLSVLLFWFCWP